MTRYTGATTGIYTGRRWTYNERRAAAISYAETETVERVLPDVGPCIGRVFMGPRVVPIGSSVFRLHGLVPKSYGGIAKVYPSWDAMEGYFRRKQLMQDRRHFQP